MRLIISFNNKNVILPEPLLPRYPADDEIWYTSTDGNIVTPFRTSSLPTIVSNTNVDGKGIFKFSKELTVIGDYAFWNCSSLTSVTIPNSVTIFGDRAFLGCTSLTSISYTGTIAQYNAIDKGLVWKNGVPATVVHCTDGDAPI